MASSTNISLATQIQIEDAERQIREYSRSVKFTVTEYTFEFIVQKLTDGRYYVPGYQRELIWTPAKQSKFIESIFMGLPIPFVFFWQDQGGKMEIVDGSQRLRTIKAFMNNEFRLRGLETIPAANGLRFSDLPVARQLKFSETGIRVIILDNSTDDVTRTEMFARINTGGTTANEAEVRRGSLPGPFMDLIISLAESRKFVKLTHISKPLVSKREREELVTRFFAYLESFDPKLTAADKGNGDIPDYKEEPRRFYFAFVKKMNVKIASEISQTGNSITLATMTSEFQKVLDFVEKVSPHGFAKSKTGNQIPRVRFEAIAVGSAIALRENANIFQKVKNITPLLDSEKFKDATRSDAANVKSKLLGRIRLVRDWLLAQ